MINSIKYFEEECINRFEKLEDDFMKEPGKLAEYVIGLTEELHNLGLRMIQESLEEMNGMLRKSQKRLQHWVVESHETKQLITSLGTVTFEKTLFTNKKTGESEYLLDRIIGLEKHERMSEDALARMLKEAVQTSYRRGGDGKTLEMPFWLKLNMTIKDAAAYSNIGINRIEELLTQPKCNFVLYVGNKKLVKRKEFEQYISKRIELLKICGFKFTELMI